ncbi:MAG: nuclear transport factor 2 family protein [Burkholderiaceae bacterium]
MNISSNLLDEIAIARLLADWGLWRDTGRWERLRAAYTPDATMKTTWFDGPASEFVDASVRAFGKPTTVQHFIGPSTVEVNGDRAVAETRVILMLRDTLEGEVVDVTCYGRFVDRMVRQDGRWLIQGRLAIYEKDRMVALDPAKPLAIDRAILDCFPSGYRHLAYLQSLGGARIVTDIPAHNSDAQRVLYADAAAWLQAA